MSIIGPTWFFRDLYLYQEFNRVARYLLGYDPEQAEDGAATYPLEQQVRNRDFVVIKILRGGKPIDSGYIVSRHGTRYTTSVLPEELPPEGILTWELPDPSPKLVLRRLDRLSKAIKRASFDLYEQFEVKAKLNLIQSWSAGEPPAIYSPEYLLSRILSSIASKEPRKNSDIIGGAVEYINDAVTEFAMLRCSGQVAQKVVATLAFFAFHPRPAKLRVAFHQQHAGFPIEGLNPGKKVIIVPPMDVQLYLVHPDTVSDDSFRASVSAARFLRTRARALRRAALSAAGYIDFQFQLYGALLYYLAAQEIYAKLKYIGDHVPGLWAVRGLDQSQINDFWIETEEARVSILTALHDVAVPWPSAWSPSRPTRFLRQVTKLWANEGLDQALLRLDDLTVRLICPSIIRDIAAALLYLYDNRPTDRWLNRISTILETLEEDLRRNLGDANYLHYAYWIAAEMNRKNGRIKEAIALDEKWRQLPSQIKNIAMSCGR